MKSWAPLNVLFVTDFDETCSVEDATDNLIELACKGSWIVANRFFSSIDEHETRMKSYFRTLIREEGFADDDDELRRLLKRSGESERLANKEIFDSKCLQGLRRETIQENVRGRIPLQQDCARVLKRVVKEMNKPIYVISANWSKDNIAGKLKEYVGDKLVVYSNDLIYDSDGVSTGEVKEAVSDSFDKEQILKGIKRKYSPGTKVVYLGDSPTDLLPMLEADLGIVVGNNANLRLVAEHCNIQLLPLCEAAKEIHGGSADGKDVSFRGTRKLFVASQDAAWNDIELCLFGN